MIRFGRLFDAATDAERRKLAAVEALFRKVFPREPEAADRLGWLIARRAQVGADVCVLTAEDQRSAVLGFALVYYFTPQRFAFLDYIASAPDQRRRGIGQALYEAVREYAAAKGARGLFLEVPPDDPADVAAGAVPPQNRQRVKFYERFGAYPIVGTRWNDPPVRPDYDPPYLVFDPLGRSGRLSRRDARAAAREILRARYGRDAGDPYTVAIVESFADDPVRLRPARYRQPPQAVRPVHRQIRPLKVLASAHHEIHHVREKGYVERPARVRAVLGALEELPIELRQVPHVGEAPIRAVHDPDFVSYLARATAGLADERTIYPEVFPIRRPDRKPREMAVRAGYYCSDTFTPLSRSAYRAARAAVDCAVAGAALLEAGEMLVYSICRPPGHHAERRVYGGFCYFNNAAIAAQRLSVSGTVALLDVDYHHGNGQQDIFYRRRDVLTLSIHGDPRDHYPYFAGFADERGEGDGLGFNRNYPLKGPVGDEAYLKVLESALGEISQFRPVWLVVCLGLDVMEGDPTGNFGLTAAGIRRVGEAIAELGLPTLVVQEGGYTLRNLRIGSRAFFSGLIKAWYV